MAVDNLSKVQIEALETQVERARAVALLINAAEYEETSARAASVVVDCLGGALKILNGATGEAG